MRPCQLVGKGKVRMDQEWSVTRNEDKRHKGLMSGVVLDKTMMDESVIVER
jgi:hypothetical protein